MNRTEAERTIAKELESDERILWVGVPKQGVRLRHNDSLLIPFSLVWGGFAIYWEAGVLRDGLFAVFGIPFVILGLYLIIGRFFVDARQRAATAYGVTNKRAIVVSGLFSRSVQSLSLKTLTDVTLSERPDGSGSIFFGSQATWSRWFAGVSWPGMWTQPTPSFDLISDAKNVYSVLRTAQSAA